MRIPNLTLFFDCQYMASIMIQYNLLHPTMTIANTLVLPSMHKVRMRVDRTRSPMIPLTDRTEY